MSGYIQRFGRNLRKSLLEKEFRFGMLYGSTPRKLIERLLFPRQKLLMSKSTIEPNGLHYPEVSFCKDPNCRGVRCQYREPSPCYFAGCVPNMPCKVEEWQMYQALYIPTNLDDLDY